jgi:hypothetical protein
MYHGPIYVSPALDIIFLDCACSLRDSVSVNASDAFAVDLSDCTLDVLTAYPSNKRCVTFQLFDNSGTGSSRQFMANAGINMDKQPE